MARHARRHRHVIEPRRHVRQYESALEWLQEGDHVVVRRAVRHSTNAVHQALFPADEPASPPKTLTELKQGIRQQVKRRHASA